ncbi:uncharacterized protein LOC116045721 [Sander lucioperca]|uniref:uncharacterized protein LOC116045721 n=1 Tax=Sander lucioperca TaxID=283035 RepID=UPI0016535CC6|nr:uncharacterized protein LOC116045721 [Sander lucioperca]
MKCGFCGFLSSSQEALLRHHRLRHRRGSHWPCIYSDCVCTFKTPGALKSHLTRSHCRTVRRQVTSSFFCELCEFKETCTERTFFTHLGHHLKNQHTVHCPFLRCEFKTNNLKTFSSHRSRKHKNAKDIRTCLRVHSEQYEDPDFGNAVCNLMDIAELPPEKAVLHIIWNIDESQTPSHSSSISSLDTASISSPASSHSSSSIIRTFMRNISEWPSPFVVPSFSYDVELKLRKGNDIYEKTGQGLSVTRDMKMEILDKLAQEIFALKAYPEKYQIVSVASELVNKHPCLKEPGSGTGYDGWTTSIKYKLGNYRSKLRQAGCNEVSVNRKRGRDDEVDEGRFSLKKPKRGEVNHVPDHPENYNDETLEDQRCVLVGEMKKKGKDMELIRQKMDLTFSLRRKEIVEVEPMVLEIQERWPALFLREQICEEFFRVTTKDLLGTFRAALDEYCPRLLKLYRARRGACGQDMENLLDRLDEQERRPAAKIQSDEAYRNIKR